MNDSTEENLNEGEHRDNEVALVALGDVVDNQGDKAYQQNGSQSRNHEDSEPVPEIEPHKIGVEIDNPDLGESDEKPAYDVVGIHGLHGQSRNSWKAPEPSSENTLWLSKIFSDKSKHGRVILYGYDSGDASGACFTFRGIYAEARVLLERLHGLRTPEIQAERRPIYFISHDMGGLIVKAALILASRENSEYADILHHTRAVVFFGYPHRHITTDTLEEQVIRLLSLKPNYYPEGRLVRLVNSLSKTIIGINGAFIHTKLLSQACFVNMISTHEDLQQMVFDRFTATMGTSLEVQELISKSHLELPVTSSSPLQNISNSDWLGGDMSNESFDVLRQRLRRASPIYPSLEGHGFFNISELENLAQKESSQIIHIQCPSGASSVSEKVQNYLREARTTDDLLLYFRFNAQDIRFSTVTNMLERFIIQIIFNRTNTLGASMDRVLALNSGLEQWTQEELICDWEYLMVFSNVLNSIHILGCLDECDESSLRFLSRLRQYVTTTESALKVVIITTKGTSRDRQIVDELSKFPTDLVASIDYTLPSRISIQVDFEVSMLMQQNHRFDTNSFQNKITDFVSRHTMDHELVSLLSGLLERNRDPLKSLPRLLTPPNGTGPESIFEYIMTEIPHERRLWAQRLMSYMLSSFRPLRTFEFSYISELCLDPKVATHAYEQEKHDWVSLKGILEYFGGMLNVTHDEVQFSHSAIRHWLLAGSEANKSWYKPKTESDRHLDILKICLAHLCKEFGPSDSVEFWAAQLPYVTEFWTAHWKRAGRLEDLKILETVFEHQPTFGRWMDAYALFSTTKTTPITTRHDQLPVAAHFGLEDIVSSLLSTKHGTLEAKGQALVESSRMGELVTLRIILESYPLGLDFNDCHLHEAVTAASLRGHGEILQELILSIRNPRNSLYRQGNMQDVLQGESSNKEKLEPQHEDGQTAGKSVSEGDKNIQCENKPDAESLQQASDKDGSESRDTYGPVHWMAMALDQASMVGLDDVVEKLLSLGADPNAPGRLNNELILPLHRAARCGQAGAAERLIAGGARIDAQDLRGRTPLHMAAGSTRAHDVVSLLLEHGAAVDYENDFSWTPLHNACQWGNVASGEALLQHKSFQEYIPADKENQPLCLAVRRGNFKTAKVLLRFKADPNTRGRENETALMGAIRTNRKDLCRLLLEYGADPDLAPEGSQLPLIQAVWSKNLDIVKLLIDHKANIEAKEIRGNGWQRTPLHVAVFSRSAEMVKLFISLGADPNVLDSDGWSPLWTAATYGLEAIVRMLAEANADVNVVCSESKTTALYQAVDHPETVRVLLESGADINAQSKSWTPLAYAVSAGYLKSVEIMLSEAKTRPDLSLDCYKPAIAHAIWSNHAEIISIILEAGADVNLKHSNNIPLISIAFREENPLLVRNILEYRPDLSLTDTFGNTPLHYSSSKTPIESVRLLINAKANIKALNKFNSTPFMTFVMNDNETVVRYLLSKHVSPSDLATLPSEDARGPLHIACQHASLSMVQLLVEHGCDISLGSTAYHGTPLMAATLRWHFINQEGSEEIVRYLLDKGARPDIGTGLFGCPIIISALSASSKIVKWLLERDIPLDVEDTFCRRPAHLASYNSLEVLEVLGIPDSDFACRDVVGRVPLHYAVLSGQVDLVKEVLERSKRVAIGVDVEDMDGWTPLLWAARSSSVFGWKERRTPNHEEVVSFLLSEGARTDTSGRVPDKSWTATEIAFFHHADSIARLIRATESPSKKYPKHRRRGQKHDSRFCDCCLVQVSGTYFTCSSCLDFDVCFKCHMSVSLIHPQHEFLEQGSGWDSNTDDADSDDEAASAPRSKEDISVEDRTQALEDQFDDEVVGDDDLTSSS